MKRSTITVTLDGRAAAQLVLNEDILFLKLPAQSIYQRKSFQLDVACEIFEPLQRKNGFAGC